MIGVDVDSTSGFPSFGNLFGSACDIVDGFAFDRFENALIIT